jgi:hypothetical protein
MQLGRGALWRLQSMETNLADISGKKKAIKVPSICINNRSVVITGKWIRMATVHDEAWLEGQVVDPPGLFIEELKESALDADIFTFSQKIPDVKPRYKYPMQWDNAAAIPITSFQEWWERVSTDMRKDLKRASRRGVIAKTVEFNDEFIQGVVGIHNDAAFRQGTPFAHYGKDFDTVKKEYSTYLDRSEFIGAFYKSEMIGLIKMVYVGELACFMQILSKTSHYDKRPTNALIAKAVEICEQKRKSYLTYGKYYYGNKKKSSLVDFKHRNGFEHILFPRYYVPLTLKGRIAIKLKLHLGLKGILPSSVIAFLVDLRANFYRRALLRSAAVGQIETRSQDEKLPEGQGRSDSCSV